MVKINCTLSSDRNQIAGSVTMEDMTKCMVHELKVRNLLKRVSENLDSPSKRLYHLLVLAPPEKLMPRSITEGEETMLTNFWTSLSTAAPVNHPLVSNGSRSGAIFRNKCLPEIAMKIGFDVRANQSRLLKICNHRNYGIGKGVFFFNLLWRLKQDSAETVTPHRQQDCLCIYVFQQGRCFRTMDFGLVGTCYLGRRSTWYLLVNLPDGPGHLPAITVVVRHPERRQYKSFFNFTGSYPLLYFPVCSLNEVIAAGWMHGITSVEAESRFQLMGGIPREIWLSIVLRCSILFPAI